MVSLKGLKQTAANTPKEKPALKKTMSLSLKGFNKSVPATDGRTHAKVPVTGTETKKLSLKGLKATVTVVDDLEQTDKEIVDDPESTEIAIIPNPMQGESKASEPVIDIPPELNEQQQRFLENFNRIPETMHDADLLGAVMEDIMQELSANPDYKEFMSDECLEVMMRGLTETFKIVKASKAAKSKTPKKKTQKKMTEDQAKIAGQVKMSADGGIDLEALMNITI